MAGGEQLHRADDVDFLLRHPATGRGGGREDVHVDDRVDGRLGDDPPDHGIADVRAHKLGPPDGMRRGHDVDTDDPADRVVTRERLGDPAAEVARHTSDQDDLRHEPHLPVTLDATILPVSSNLRLPSNAERPRHHRAPERGLGHAVGAVSSSVGLLAVATLVARLAQQLAVLLLRHPLAALLDD